MDVLRKELNRIYASQHLYSEALPKAEIERCKAMAADYAALTDGCAVITDAARDRCNLFAGALAPLLGIGSGNPAECMEISSSDEDIVYNRIHPEDLVEKRMLEYEFFRHVDPMTAAQKVRFRATCRIRIRDAAGRYIPLDNSTRVLRPSPAGKIWLILCTYALSPAADTSPGIHAAITDTLSGVSKPVSFAGRKDRILSPREKEILSLVRDGLESKEIACRLSISPFTVNRHRQNILAKLSVGNSFEAVGAAIAMGLI